MSTTFGITDRVTGNVKEVAVRRGMSTFNKEKGIQSKVNITTMGKNELFILNNMDPETPVVAMDNSSQGINTVGDIINHPGFIGTM